MATATRAAPSGKRRQVFAAGANHARIVAVRRVRRDERRMQGCAIRGLRETLVEKRHQLTRRRTVEVGAGLLVLRLILAARPRPVQQERQDAIQESGRRVYRGDVLIKGEIAGAELNRLVGRGEQQVRQPVQRALGMRTTRGRNAVECVVEAGGLVDVGQPLE